MAIWQWLLPLLSAPHPMCKFCNEEQPMAKLLPTKNDLPSNAKSAVIDMLNARVADSIDLALVTKQAHWNLKGMSFIGVHELLDKLRGELDPYVDSMAERAVQLGGVALGTAQTVIEKTTLPPYPT